MAETQSPHDKRKLNFWILAFILVGVFVLWALAGWGVHHFAGKEGRGTFGDMFGAVNALFSGFAFACLIYAVFMQREELSLQREELKLAREEAAATRDEIRGQKEQAIAQNATLSQQTFENTFFQLLNHHVEIMNRHEDFCDGGFIMWVDASFGLYFERMVSNYNSISSNSSTERSEVLRTFVENLAPSMDQSVRALSPSRCTTFLNLSMSVKLIK